MLYQDSELITKDDIRNNFNIFLIPNNIRNNLCVPDIMRNHLTKNVPHMAMMPILIV